MNALETQQQKKIFVSLLSPCISFAKCVPSHMAHFSPLTPCAVMTHPRDWGCEGSFSRSLFVRRWESLPRLMDLAKL